LDAQDLQEGIRALTEKFRIDLVSFLIAPDLRSVKIVLQC